MTSHYSIGQLAKTAGVNVETIRYYERQGLITQPPKTALVQVKGSIHLSIATHHPGHLFHEYH